MEFGTVGVTARRDTRISNTGCGLPDWIISESQSSSDLDPLPARIRRRKTADGIVRTELPAIVRKSRETTTALGLHLSSVFDNQSESEGALSANKTTLEIHGLYR